MAHKEKKRENVWLGVLGAFLFSLSGGVIYFLLDRLGYISGLSAAVGAAAALFGYGLFSGRQGSKRGVVAAAVSTLIVVCAAMIFCLAFELHEVVNEDYADVTLWQTLKDTLHALRDSSFDPSYGIYIYPLDRTVIWKNFAGALLFTALGLVSFIAGRNSRKPVPAEESPAPQPATPEFATPEASEPATTAETADRDRN